MTQPASSSPEFRTITSHTSWLQTKTEVRSAGSNSNITLQSVSRNWFQRLSNAAYSFCTKRELEGRFLGATVIVKRLQNPSKVEDVLKEIAPVLNKKELDKALADLRKLSEHVDATAQSRKPFLEKGASEGARRRHGRGGEDEGADSEGAGSELSGSLEREGESPQQQQQPRDERSLNLEAAPQKPTPAPSSAKSSPTPTLSSEPGAATTVTQPAGAGQIGEKEQPKPAAIPAQPVSQSPAATQIKPLQPAQPTVQQAKPQAAPSQPVKQPQVEKPLLSTSTPVSQTAPVKPEKTIEGLNPGDEIEKSEVDKNWRPIDENDVLTPEQPIIVSGRNGRHFEYAVVKSAKPNLDNDIVEYYDGKSGGRNSLKSRKSIYVLKESQPARAPVSSALAQTVSASPATPAKPATAPVKPEKPAAAAAPTPGTRFPNNEVARLEPIGKPPAVGDTVIASMKDGTGYVYAIVGQPAEFAVFPDMYSLNCGSFTTDFDLEEIYKLSAAEVAAPAPAFQKAPSTVTPNAASKPVAAPATTPPVSGLPKAEPINKPVIIPQPAAQPADVAAKPGDKFIGDINTLQQVGNAYPNIGEMVVVKRGDQAFYAKVKPQGKIKGNIEISLQEGSSISVDQSNVFKAPATAADKEFNRIFDTIPKNIPIFRASESDSRALWELLPFVSEALQQKFANFMTTIVVITFPKDLLPSAREHLTTNGLKYFTPTALISLFRTAYGKEIFEGNPDLWTIRDHEGFNAITAALQQGNLEDIPADKVREGIRNVLFKQGKRNVLSKPSVYENRPGNDILGSSLKLFEILTTRKPSTRERLIEILEADPELLTLITQQFGNLIFTPEQLEGITSRQAKRNNVLKAPVSAAPASSPVSQVATPAAAAPAKPSKPTELPPVMIPAPAAAAKPAGVQPEEAYKPMDAKALSDFIKRIKNFRGLSHMNVNIINQMKKEFVAIAKTGDFECVEKIIETFNKNHVSFEEMKKLFVDFFGADTEGNPQFKRLKFEILPIIPKDPDLEGLAKGYLNLCKDANRFPDEFPETMLRVAQSNVGKEFFKENPGLLSKLNKNMENVVGYAIKNMVLDDTIPDEAFRKGFEALASSKQGAKFLENVINLFIDEDLDPSLLPKLRKKLGDELFRELLKAETSEGENFVSLSVKKGFTDDCIPDEAFRECVLELLNGPKGPAFLKDFIEAFMKLPPNRYLDSIVNFFSKKLGDDLFLRMVTTETNGKSFYSELTKYMTDTSREKLRKDKVKTHKIITDLIAQAQNKPIPAAAGAAAPSAKTVATKAEATTSTSSLLSKPSTKPVNIVIDVPPPAAQPTPSVEPKKAASALTNVERNAFVRKVNLLKELNFETDRELIEQIQLEFADIANKSDPAYTRCVINIIKLFSKDKTEFNRLLGTMKDVILHADPKWHKKQSLANILWELFPYVPEVGMQFLGSREPNLLLPEELSSESAKNFLTKAISQYFIDDSKLLYDFYRSPFGRDVFKSKPELWSQLNKNNENVVSAVLCCDEKYATDDIARIPTDRLNEGLSLVLNTANASGFVNNFIENNKEDLLTVLLQLKDSLKNDELFLKFLNIRDDSGSSSFVKFALANLGVTRGRQLFNTEILDFLISRDNDSELGKLKSLLEKYIALPGFKKTSFDQILELPVTELFAALENLVGPQGAGQAAAPSAGAAPSAQPAGKPSSAPSSSSTIFVVPSPADFTPAPPVGAPRTVPLESKGDQVVVRGSRVASQPSAPNSAAVTRTPYDTIPREKETPVAAPRAATVPSQAASLSLRPSLEPQGTIVSKPSGGKDEAALAIRKRVMNLKENETADAGLVKEIKIHFNRLISLDNDMSCMNKILKLLSKDSDLEKTIQNALESSTNDISKWPELKEMKARERTNKIANLKWELMSYVDPKISKNFITSRIPDELFLPDNLSERAVAFFIKNNLSLFNDHPDLLLKLTSGQVGQKIFEQFPEFWTHMRKGNNMVGEALLSCSKDSNIFEEIPPSELLKGMKAAIQTNPNSSTILENFAMQDAEDLHGALKFLKNTNEEAFRTLINARDSSRRSFFMMIASRIDEPHHQQIDKNNHDRNLSAILQLMIEANLNSSVPAERETGKNWNALLIDIKKYLSLPGASRPALIQLGTNSIAEQASTLEEWIATGEAVKAKQDAAKAEAVGAKQVKEASRLEQEALSKKANEEKAAALLQEIKEAMSSKNWPMVVYTITQAFSEELKPYSREITKVLDAEFTEIMHAIHNNKAHSDDWGAFWHLLPFVSKELQDEVAANSVSKFIEFPDVLSHSAEKHLKDNLFKYLPKNNRSTALFSLSRTTYGQDIFRERPSLWYERNHQGQNAVSFAIAAAQFEHIPSDIVLGGIKSVLNQENGLTILKTELRTFKIGAETGKFEQLSQILEEDRDLISFMAENIKGFFTPEQLEGITARQVERDNAFNETLNKFSAMKTIEKVKYPSQKWEEIFEALPFVSKEMQLKFAQLFSSSAKTEFPKNLSAKALGHLQNNIYTYFPTSVSLLSLSQSEVGREIFLRNPELWSTMIGDMNPVVTSLLHPLTKALNEIAAERVQEGLKTYLETDGVNPDYLDTAMKNMSEDKMKVLREKLKGDATLTQKIEDMYKKYKDAK